jgi:protease-4
MLAGTQQTGPDEPTIAIIHADGVIRMGLSGSGLFDDEQFVGHESLIQAFETARLDDNIKAVVFRINSPGGSALASELIYQAAARCNRDKPVVVSISSMAASGGYYIAMGGRQIFSDPAAIIGSIGVVGGKISTEGLMEKLKIRTTSFTRGANAGLALSRPWTRRELKVVRQQIDRTYDLFVRRVKQGRGEKIANVSRIAQGRVFTAKQGLENGMIDQIGGIREAVIVAQRLSGSKARNYIDLPRPKTLADLLGGPTGASMALPGGAGIESRALRAILAEKPSLGYLLSLSRLLGQREILTALPYGLDIRR